jgi:hypothetical protein
MFELRRQAALRSHPLLAETSELGSPPAHHENLDSPSLGVAKAQGRLDL